MKKDIILLTLFILLVFSSFEPIMIKSVKAKQPTSFTITVSPNPVSFGSYIIADGILTPAPQNNYRVHFYYTRPNATVISRSVLVAGGYQPGDYYKPDQVGTWAVYAEFPGDDQLEGSRSNTVIFEVTTEGFSIHVDAQRLGVWQGCSTWNLIRVNATVQRFYTVNLSVSGLPPGVSGIFNPSSGTPPFTSNLTLFTSVSTPPNDYEIIVNGTGDGYSSSNTFILGVSSPVTSPLIHKIPHRIEISLLSGNWEEPNSQFQIDVYDISMRIVDVLTRLTPEEGDNLILRWVGVLKDRNGDGKIDLDEIAENMKDSLTKQAIEKYMEFLTDRALKENLQPPPSHYGDNLWSQITNTGSSILSTIKEYAPIAISIIVIPFSIFSGAGITTTFGTSGYSCTPGVYSPISSFTRFGSINTVQSLCLADLLIIDSQGCMINKTFSTIKGAMYVEQDVNGDGSLDDVVTLPPTLMNYKIYVVQEAIASPNDTFTLRVVSDKVGLDLVTTSFANMSKEGYTLQCIDLTPPEIGVPSQEPHDHVMPLEPVRILVNVTDDYRVENVTIYYTIDNGTSWLISQTSFNYTTQLYEAIIPGHSAGTWVKYKIVAYDNAGNLAYNDNFGQYYVYEVVPEFSSPIHLLLMILPIIILVSLMRKVIIREENPEKF
ncbi:MAG: hypothetical protein QXU21_07685 [Candidatus Bathyarchaeia archaeon]